MITLSIVNRYCMGWEKMNQPVTIINTGDTGPFTDGSMHMLQHVIEAQERGMYTIAVLL